MKCVQDLRQSETSGLSLQTADEISEYSEVSPTEKDAPPEEAGEKQTGKEESKDPLNVTFKKHEQQSGAAGRDESTKILSQDLERYAMTPNDSNDPSYTNLVLPYTVVCRLRYHKAAKTITNQFKKELRQHELFQNKALDGVRIHREFCKYIFRNPRKSEMIQITPAQKAKIEAIMNRQY